MLRRLFGGAVFGGTELYHTLSTPNLTNSLKFLRGPGKENSSISSTFLSIQVSYIEALNQNNYGWPNPAKAFNTSDHSDPVFPIDLLDFC